MNQPDKEDQDFCQTRTATFCLSADVDAHWFLVGKAHRAS